MEMRVGGGKNSTRVSWKRIEPAGSSSLPNREAGGVGTGGGGAVEGGAPGGGARGNRPPQRGFVGRAIGNHRKFKRADNIPSAFQRLLGPVGRAFARWGWAAEDAAAGARDEAGVPEGRGLAAMPQFPCLYNEGLGRMVSQGANRRNYGLEGEGVSFRLRGLYPAFQEGDGVGRGGAGQLPLPPYTSDSQLQSSALAPPFWGPYPGTSSPRGLPPASKSLPLPLWLRWPNRHQSGNTCGSPSVPTVLCPWSSAHRWLPAVPVALHWAQGRPGAQRPLP